MRKQEEYPFTPKVVQKVYKITNQEGYYYIGLTKHGADKCIRQHYDKSLAYPHSKVYKHLSEDLKRGKISFEVIEEITSNIGGELPTVYDCHKKLDDYIVVHRVDPLCLNERHGIGLSKEVHYKCRCGGLYIKRKYKQHLQTEIHQTWKEEYNISTSSD